jgi:serine/threonine protein kinase/formylglycine-generating enzyme required for sulfatase activity
MGDDTEKMQRYAVGDEFAHGGVGAIHAAQDAALNRDVAYKVLLEHRDNIRSYRLRFVREARLTAQLEHPNIVPVHDLGVNGEGQLFFTMKRVRGRTLDQVLRQLRRGDAKTAGDFPLPRLLSVFNQMCQAVHYAHTRGVLHRDLKPANVMVGGFGETLVMDWGLAKRIPAIGTADRLEYDDEAEAAETLAALAADDTGRLRGLLDEDLPAEESLAESEEFSEPPRPVEGRLDVVASSEHDPTGSSWDPLGEDGRSAGTFQTIDGRVMGTPTHMSPEQASGRELDHRSDVYSLGVILYELLTLKTPFSGRETREIMLKVVRGRFRRPTVRAPERGIDPAIEDICLRAMARQPDDRPATVWDLFEEVEAFLQGRTERDRRTRASKERLEEGLERLRRWEELCVSADAARRRTGRLAQEVEPWMALVERRRLWASEDEAERLELEAVGVLAEVELQLHEALRLDEDNHEARSTLAELHWNRLEQAERTGDRAGSVRAKADLLSVDDGTWRRILEAPGALSVTSEPAATATLYRLEEVDRRLVPTAPVELGPTPVAETTQPPGRYLLIVRARGFVPVRVPLRLGRGERPSVHVTLFNQDQVGDGFVHIPAGSCLIGGDPEAHNCLRGQTAELPDYAVAVFPTTMAQYLEFLNDLDDRDEAWARSPRGEPRNGHYLARADDGTLSLPDADPNGHKWNPRLPVMAVSFDDAVAYIEWRSARDGVRYRLPTDAEWEKAGRGTAGRIYPWGDHLERSYCHTSAVAKEVQPLPVGSIREDESPYGVRDMAGGARDWVDGWKTQAQKMRAMKGGAWWDRPHKSRLGERTGWPADNVYGDSGFRLVKSLPPELPGPALVSEHDPRRGGVRIEDVPER